MEMQIQIRQTSTPVPTPLWRGPYSWASFIHNDHSPFFIDVVGDTLYMDFEAKYPLYVYASNGHPVISSHPLITQGEPVAVHEPQVVPA